MKIIEVPVQSFEQHAYCDHGHEYKPTHIMRTTSPPVFPHLAADGCQTDLPTTYPRIVNLRRATVNPIKGRTCTGHTWTRVIEDNLARTITTGWERSPDHLICATHRAELIIRDH